MTALPSSAAPATPARRRSTACSRTPRSSRSRSAPTRSPGSPPGARPAARRLAAAFVTNAEAAASGADVLFLCLDNDEAAAFEPPADTVVVDLSGAHRLARPRPRARLVRQQRPAPGATACPSSPRPQGPLIANPGCYATAALLALGAARRRDRRGDRRREVRRLRRGPVAEGVVARRLRARELLAVRGRRAPARAGDRAAARLRRSASSPTCCPCAAACSPPVTCRPSADVRALLEDAYAASAVVRVLPEGVDARARTRAGHRRRRDRRLRRRRDRHRDRDLRARQPRQGRRRPGGAEREPRARPRRDRRAAARTGCWYERHRAQRASSRRGVHAQASGARSARTSRCSARSRRPPARRCGRRTACRRRRSSSRKRHLALAEPQAVVDQLRRRERRDRRAGRARRASRPPSTRPRLLGLAPEQVLVLSTGVIGAPLPLDRCCAGSSPRPRRSRRTAAPTRPRRS